jgi:zinc transport system permease protein
MDQPGFWESWFLWWQPLTVAALAAVLCAFVGVYIVLRRTVFVSAALSQLSGVGVAISFWLASLLGIEPHHAPWYLHPIWFALAFAAAGAAIFSLHLARRRLAAETVVGLGYLIGAACMILVLNSRRVTQEAHEVNDLLYGNAVAVPPEQLVIMLATTVAVLAVHFAFYKDFVFVSFDGEMARTLGYRTWLWNLLLFSTFAVTVSVSTRAIGALPVFGFMVLPPAAALLLGRRLWEVFAIAVGVAVAATAIGYYASFRLELPTGASMVVAAACFLALGLARFAWERR